MAINVLRVFVAKSFAEQDRPKVARIESLLDTFATLGVVWETGEPAEPESISQKVRERIDSAQVFVGIVTRRHPIILKVSDIFDLIRRRTQRWTAPPWVLQETGYALKAGKRIILFIEPGVDFGGLQSDLEYIPYEAQNPSTAITRAIDMMNRLIRARACGRKSSGESVSERRAVQFSSPA
jgi:hypothetical protein